MDVVGVDSRNVDSCVRLLDVGYADCMARIVPKQRQGKIRGVGCMATRWWSRVLANTCCSLVCVLA